MRTVINRLKFVYLSLYNIPIRWIYIIIIFNLFDIRRRVLSFVTLYKNSTKTPKICIYRNFEFLEERNKGKHEK